VKKPDLQHARSLLLALHFLPFLYLCCVYYYKNHTYILLKYPLD
jgi:hypothetical protein